MTWRYFNLDEFDCRHCGKNEMAFDFIDRLDNMRHVLGFPLVVTSGYRCPVHNQAVSSTGPDGPHTTGRACDLAVDRMRAFEVLRFAMDNGFTGIGVKQKGSSRFIHLDDLPAELDRLRPTVWSY